MVTLGRALVRCNRIGMANQGSSLLRCRCKGKTRIWGNSRKKRKAIVHGRKKKWAGKGRSGATHKKSKNAANSRGAVVRAGRGRGRRSSMANRPLAGDTAMKWHIQCKMSKMCRNKACQETLPFGSKKNARSWRISMKKHLAGHNTRRRDLP